MVTHTAPWLAGFEAQLATAFDQPDWGQLFNTALQLRGVRNAQGAPVVLVEQGALPEGEAYESFIHRTGQVPTRNNRHDFFNALLWLHLPRSKARLNALQAQAIARDGIGAQRGALRDFCTLLDENGLLMIAPTPAATALAQRDWQGLLVQQRAQWGRDIHVLPAGHALLEKLANPYKAITAHVMVLRVSQSALRSIHAPFEAKMAQEAHEYCVLFDELLVNALQAPEPLRSSALLPLPVLGIPGWWAANQDAQFYADAAVFRPQPAAAGAAPVQAARS